MAPATPIKNLKAKLGTVTDPAQQARINQRIQFLQGQNKQMIPRVSGVAPATPGLGAKAAPPAIPPAGAPAAGAPAGKTFTGLGKTGYGLGKHGSHAFTGANPNAVVTPTTPAAGTPTIPVLDTKAVANPATPAPATPAPGTAETLFPSTRMFEPQNYEGSPLYQFQLKEGQKQVARSLAARGLTNSGYGIEQELNVPLRAAAQDTDRMTRIASENADRLKSFQDNEALRLERQGNNQWDRAYSIAQLMADQSPWNAAVAGLNNSADVVSAAGNAQANYLRDAYGRIIPNSGGGGGGGGGTPIQLPSGPDYSNITPLQIKGDYSSNNGWMNILTNGLTSLFPK